MKLVLVLSAIVFSMVSIGADSSTYATLTNKFSQCLANGSWEYETNGVVQIRKILLPIRIDNQFSDEIVSSLRKCCPREWNDAISSSGNTANPSMLPLRQHFDNAVLHTPTIAKFQSVARSLVGQDVVLRINHEKLSYNAVDVETPNKGNRIIRCFLWVEVCDVN